MFAWESSEMGTNLHLQSEPTKLEMMKKHVEDKKSDLGDNQKSQILEKVRVINPREEISYAQNFLWKKWANCRMFGKTEIVSLSVTNLNPKMSAALLFEFTTLINLFVSNCQNRIDPKSSWIVVQDLGCYCFSSPYS